MSKRVRRRRGTSTQHDEFTGAGGELTVNTSDHTVHVHDGSTAGGFKAARDSEVLKQDQNLSDLDDASAARSNLGVTGSTAGGDFPNVDADVTATDEELNNADADTAGGGFLIGPTGSADPGLAFDTWRTPNADRGTLVSVSVVAVTDGTNLGSIEMNVDESGGTIRDYFFDVFASGNFSSGTGVVGNFSFFVPAGGSYQIENASDPDANNRIDTVREWTL